MRSRDLLKPLVAGASDAALERRFGHPLVVRALFAGMTRGFRADKADGFQGDLSYELTRPATAREPLHYVISVGGRHATARPGRTAGAAVTARFRLADFARVAAGTLDPTEAVLNGRATVVGDLALAARLQEMFDPG